MAAQDMDSSGNNSSYHQRTNGDVSTIIASGGWAFGNEQEPSSPIDTRGGNDGDDQRDQDEWGRNYTTPGGQGE